MATAPDRTNDDSHPPFEACAKAEPFIFASYAHLDSATVYPELRRLHELGFRIWYDEGIASGEKWAREVAKALVECSYFLLFVSPQSLASENVCDEIEFALNRKKPFLAVHLEPIALPIDLELRMGRIQAILRYDMPDDRWYERQIERTLPQTLRGTPPAGTGQREEAPEQTAELIDAVAGAVNLRFFNEFGREPDFHRLDGDLKAALYARARRILNRLASIDFTVETVSPDEGDTWQGALEEAIGGNLDNLAEAEHRGWCDEQVANDWVYAPVKHEGLRRNPLLVSWEKLPDSEQGRNRKLIRCIPDVLEIAACKAVPMDAVQRIDGLAGAVNLAFSRKYGGEPDFAKLDGAFKESNRAAARRIQCELASVGFTIEPATPREDGAWRAVLEEAIERNLERLAQDEHLRWSAARIANGWTYAPLTDKAHKKHSLLVTWSQMPEYERDKDRELIRWIPDILECAKYKAVMVDPQ